MPRKLFYFSLILFLTLSTYLSIVHSKQHELPASRFTGTALGPCHWPRRCMPRPTRSLTIWPTAMRTTRRHWQAAFSLARDRFAYDFPGSAGLPRSWDIHYSSIDIRTGYSHGPLGYSLTTNPYLIGARYTDANGVHSYLNLILLPLPYPLIRPTHSPPGQLDVSQTPCIGPYSLSLFNITNRNTLSDTHRVAHNELSRTYEQRIVRVSNLPYAMRVRPTLRTL